jgi:serine/threonine protein phosphatase 1
LARFGERLGIGPRRRAGENAGVDGLLVYAVGDVHGRYDLLKVMLARIADDAFQSAPRQRPVLVFCGDYIDRGPQSFEVLEALVWLRTRGDFDLHLLKGNHEQALLDFLEEPRGGADWMQYGGIETLAAYGVRPPAPGSDEAELMRARNEFLARLPASHLHLLQSLELMIVVGDYAFVHAGLRPGTSLDQQTEEDLLWIREAFTQAPGPFEKIIVHGHSWVSDRPQILPHRIGLDTGAYLTGVLTAARLQDGELSVLQSEASGDRPWNPWAAAGPIRPQQ